ncbi:ATP-binding protein [Streptomyces chartreusis]|uniref:ATP-binding protein n=1 Tax=Streptomyces chartreusis TaxID=1969 RepID=A0A7H8T3F9_STRCX|nr:ATP-binding protein [Streptomyces chartreusis]QKZ17582.1 ATP-binding protein [Streptomyces chartreusis]
MFVDDQQRALSVTAPARVARRSGPASACRMGASTKAPARARTFVLAALTQWRVDPDVIDAMRVIVSELVTNVVEHSGARDVDVALSMRGSVARIAVIDRGVWRPSRAQGAAWRPWGMQGGAWHLHGGQSCDEAEGGRGLQLVQAYASECGVVRTRRGTRAWAEVTPESNRASDVPAGGHARR